MYCTTTWHKRKRVQQCGRTKTKQHSHAAQKKGAQQEQMQTMPEAHQGGCRNTEEESITTNHD
jgi:hypothetical protein